MAKCNCCGLEMLTADGCLYKRIVVKGPRKKIFNRIKVGDPGSTIAYVDNTAYVCVSCFERHNTGYTVTDESGNDVMNTLGAGQVLLYTCNGCWQNVHVAIYSVM